LLTAGSRPQDGPVLDREGVLCSTTVADVVAVGWLEPISGISELTEEDPTRRSQDQGRACACRGQHRKV